MGFGRKDVHADAQPCSHLEDYRRRHGMEGYKSMLEISLRTASSSAGPRPKTSIAGPQSVVPRCDSCFRNPKRLYLCLICSSISCSDHVVAHAGSETGHEIFVDKERAELFCSVCADQVYDPDFDIMAGAKQIVGGGVSARALSPRSGAKRKHGGLVVADNCGASSKSWLVRDSEGNRTRATNKNRPLFPLGLRGLNNLGNTCFMNSVLQVLLHTPPLSNYFLNNGHNHDLCSRARARLKGSSGPEKACLSCDVKSLFTSVFSGDRKPYSPARFLYSWWQHAENLATYDQQDAHEFFMSILDRIHEKEKPGLQTKGISDCHCIAHRVFSGILRSDVTCTVCGYTSTTYEPCVDISLDMDICSSTEKLPRKNLKASDTVKTSTLTGCLDHFTRPEKLGSDQKLHCQHCDVRQDSLKQMSIRRLPLVFCFHIKRFEHSSYRGMSKKIDQYMEFPFSLDMTPYLSSSIIRNRFGNRIFAYEGDESGSSKEYSSEYEVFAVVTHTGRLDSGHYVTYLRLKNQWYKCDDAWVTQVSEEVVRASQGYMVYYAQKMLYRKTNEDMACLPMSPRDLNRPMRDAFLSGCF